MHANSGFRREAFSQAKRLIRLYANAESVVVPGSSCVSTMRDQYPGIFEELGSESERRELVDFLPRVYELSEFLIDRLKVEDVGAYFPHRVTYHASCHGLRGIHLGDRPFRLLNKVRGLDYVPLENIERCCGFGGTFSVKNPEISQAMLTVKLHDILSTGAEYCTALDNSCLMHLGGAMHRQFAGMRTIHLAEILASTETSIAEALA
jgi:L-lactate dehydrogenase complex protein LldE